MKLIKIISFLKERFTNKDYRVGINEAPATTTALDYCNCVQDLQREIEKQSKVIEKIKKSVTSKHKELHPFGDDFSCFHEEGDYSTAVLDVINDVEKILEELDR